MSSKSLQKSPFDGIKRATDERNVQLSQETGKISHNYCTKIQVGNQVVGIVESGVFQKRVHGSRHFLRKPPSIAFSVETIEQAQKVGAIMVKIIDLDTNLVYQVSIEVLLGKGFYFDRGFGKQIGLTLNHWQCFGIQQTNAQKVKSILNPSNNFNGKGIYMPKTVNAQPHLFGNER